MIMDAATADRLAVQVTGLFDRYNRELYGYLVKMLRDRELAADLLQETFLRALRARRDLARIERLTKRQTRRPCQGLRVLRLSGELAFHFVERQFLPCCKFCPRPLQNLYKFGICAQGKRFLIHIFERDDCRKWPFCPFDFRGN